MEFVLFESATSGRDNEVPNDVKKLNDYVKENVRNYCTYTTRVNKRFPNDHMLVRLCNYTMGYFGATPSETFENLKDRLRYVASSFSFAYVGVNVSTASYCFGNDITFCADFSMGVNFSDTGTLTDVIQPCPIRIYHHDEYSLRPADYEELTGGFGLIGIDIPLLGAMLHQTRINVQRVGGEFDIHTFLNQHYRTRCIWDMISIALRNRFQLDSYEEDSALFYEEFQLPMPYYHKDVTKDYIKAKRAYEQYFKQFTGTTVGDVFANMPTPFYKAEFAIPKLEDYYLDNLMWINALAEVCEFQRIVLLDTGYDLRLNLRPHVMRLKSLLSDRQVSNYTRDMEPALAEYVKEKMSFK